MVKTKKVLSSILVMAIAISMFAGCTKNGDEQQNAPTTAMSESAAAKNETPAYMNETGYPIVKEPVTVKVMAPKSAMNGEFKDMEVFKKMEQITGIKVEWDTPADTSFLEKRNLALASGEFPDVFLGAGFATNEEETYGSQGVFIPLDKYIENYASSFNKLIKDQKNIKEAVTATDGKIYSLPYVAQTKTSAGNIMYIDLNWLKNVNLSKPTTTDELYNVLKAFKTQDPNKNNSQDEIPLSYWKDNNQSIMFDNIILNAFSGQAGGADFDIRNGKVVFNPIEPYYKDYLMYMNKLYSEGLLDNEMFTQSQQQYIAKYKDGKMGLSLVSLSLITTAKDVDNFELLPPLTSSANSKKVTAIKHGIYTGNFAITNKCKYPEAMMRWIDLFYKDDSEAVEGISGMSMFLGILDETYKYTDSSKTKYVRESKIEGLTPVEYINKHVTPGLVGRVITSAVPDGDVLLLKKATESEKNYYPFMTDIYPSYVRYSKQDAERITFLINDVTTYIKQMRAKFIIGDESLDNWDSYVNNVKKMSIDEMIKIKQDAYDKLSKAN